jgi:succinate dehydrogenase / fumarate reductase iron-sulfur subunit
MADEKKMIRVRIKRQHDPDSDFYWEEFEIPYRRNMNVISCLMEIRKNPVTIEGNATSAPVWEMNCLENVCGSCTMLMNGRVGQSCATLVDSLAQPVTLEPMTKFPVIRDLAVDRSRMFENLKKIRGWIPIDGTYDLGPGPRIAERDRQEAYEFARCMSCGSCLEACPQVNAHSNFIGPAAIGQVRRTIRSHWWGGRRDQLRQRPELRQSLSQRDSID